MSYSKINIVVKNPSKQLEECIRKAGQEKYERMQQALRDWKSGKYKDAEVILVKWTIQISYHPLKEIYIK